MPWFLAGNFGFIFVFFSRLTILIISTFIINVHIFQNNSINSTTNIPKHRLKFPVVLFPHQGIHPN
jgi:hypothetical protein